MSAVAMIPENVVPIKIVVRNLVTSFLMTLNTPFDDVS